MVVLFNVSVLNESCLHPSALRGLTTMHLPSDFGEDAYCSSTPATYCPWVSLRGGEGGQDTQHRHANRAVESGADAVKKNRWLGSTVSRYQKCQESCLSLELASGATERLLSDENIPAWKLSTQNSELHTCGAATRKEFISLTSTSSTVGSPQKRYVYSPTVSKSIPNNLKSVTLTCQYQG